MIHFVKKHNLPKIKKAININLSVCESKEDALLLISKKIRGDSSPDLVTGCSLDALFSVMSDFFIENWLTWDDICICGWGGFSLQHPILSQQILNLIMEAYVSGISSTLRLIEWGDIDYQSSSLLLAVTEKKPCIYVVI
ncbi:hypothetical protein [Moraxella marmotae]|uniref:hypothetical protein n=1 Tax=Moraxella marmotae TaxID=3344520 RepID=UPI0035F2F5F8